MLAKGGSIGQKEDKREIPQQLVDLAKQLQAASDISGAKDFAMEKALELQDQIQTECNNFLAGPPCRVTAARCAPAFRPLRTTHRRCSLALEAGACSCRNRRRSCSHTRSLPILSACTPICSSDFIATTIVRHASRGHLQQGRGEQRQHPHALPLAQDGSPNPTSNSNPHAPFVNRGVARCESRSGAV